MTLTINLPPDIEKIARQQAAKNGQDVDAFVLQAVNEKLAKVQFIEETCAQKSTAATSVSDQFYGELARLPETIDAFEAQKAIFRKWRSDSRFEPYWSTLDHALPRTFEQVQKWSAAVAALPELEDYDFDAHQEQAECDQRHAGDHVL